jgi:hypothetical protein
MGQRGMMWDLMGQDVEIPTITVTHKNFAVHLKWLLERPAGVE